MRVLCFGAYPLGFSKNRVVVKGLRRNDVEVDECNVLVSDSDGYQEQYLKNTIPSVAIKYLQLMKRRIKLKAKNYDAIIVFQHDAIPAAKALFTKPIVFDSYVSMYEAEVEDRKRVSDRSLWGRSLYYIDKYCYELANLSILDTYQHINYIEKKFNINANKFRRVFVGTDDEVFYPRKNEERNDGIFRIIFWGGFIPLHGVQYIIYTANLLRKENDIFFQIFGSGQTFNTTYILAQKLKLTNLSFHTKWIPYERLPEYIARSDVCLGIFGITKKAKIIIPNKAYEALAMKKPLITGKSAATDECFLKNEDNCLLCNMGDPRSLADAILQLKGDDRLRERVAERGYKLFTEHFSTNKIGEKYREILLALST